MKKGKVFGKRQLVLAVMVVALGAAVWLNMQYSSANGGFLGANASSKTTSTKNLGDTKYVNGDASGSVVQTSAGTDYFANAKAEREKARTDSVKLLEETAGDVKISDAAKDAAVAKISDIAARVEKEASVENIIKAKGFKQALAMIGDKDVNIIVKNDGDLLASQTLQIQDAVVSQTGVSLDKIKIVTVK